MICSSLQVEDDVTSYYDNVSDTDSDICIIEMEDIDNLEEDFTFTEDASGKYRKKCS